MFVQEKINYSGKDYDIPHFSSILYNLRLKSGKSQQEFAQYLGISTSTYCRHESGKIRRISSYVVDAVNVKYNIPVEELLLPNTESNEYTALYEWCRRDEAIPYLQEAYQKWLSDREDTIRKRKLI